MHLDDACHRVPRTAHDAHEGALVLQHRVEHTGTVGIREHELAHRGCLVEDIGEAVRGRLGKLRLERVALVLVGKACGAVGLESLGLFGKALLNLGLFGFGLLPGLFLLPCFLVTAFHDFLDAFVGEGAEELVVGVEHVAREYILRFLLLHARLELVNLLLEVPGEFLDGSLVLLLLLGELALERVLGLLLLGEGGQVRLCGFRLFLLLLLGFRRLFLGRILLGFYRLVLILRFLGPRSRFLLRGCFGMGFGGNGLLWLFMCFLGLFLALPRHFLADFCFYFFGI